MLTLTLTYRNRDLSIVKRCLQSLQEQTHKNFKVVLVDYGSTPQYAKNLERLCKAFSFVNLITCPVVGQLWNKSRAINIALKQCTTPLFCVADIDLLFHPEFVNKSESLLKDSNTVYFQTGFLSEQTTEKALGFTRSEPQFLGNDEVTGISLYRTEILKSINGYDEFYHGWGAEDTDVHWRLKNAGHRVYFYQDEILVKHQWHPKTYRTKASRYPFHTRLERINHSYMLQRQRSGATQANTNMPWGLMPTKAQRQRLEEDLPELRLSNQCSDIDAFLVGVLPQLSAALKVQIQCVPQKERLKQRLKYYLGKKTLDYYDLETINNQCLEALIAHQRLALYHFKTHWKNQTITLSLCPYAET